MSELERKLLGKLSSPEDMTEAWEAGVRAEQFEEPIYGAVWNFSTEYWQQSQMKSVPTDWMLAKEFGGYTQAQDVKEETFYLAERLRQRYVANQLQSAMMTTAAKTASDPLGALKELQSMVNTAAEITVRRLTRVNMADTIEARRARYAAKQDYPQGTGLPYGLDLLDLFTGGLEPGELCVVGARAKTGKTMFGLNAMVAALRQGYRPMVFTLEMSLKEIETRVDSIFSGVSYDRLLHARLNDKELEQLHTGQDELASLGGMQIEMPEEGDRTVASLLARARQYGTNYLLIDQLSHMEPPGKVTSLKDHHASIVKALKTSISRPGSELPVILASQFRRDDEEINLASFSNATEIEQTADILIGLWRNQDLRNNSAMMCEILGSRRSDMGKFLLGWELTSRTEIRAMERVHT